MCQSSLQKIELVLQQKRCVCLGNLYLEAAMFLSL